MKLFKLIVIYFVIFTNTFLVSAEFTISSYNCGGLTDHYDYIRAASMQKIMQERTNAEPEQMSLNEKIQKLALKIQFSPNPSEKADAQREWDQKGYQKILESLTASPTDPNGPHFVWNQKVEQTLSSYKVRPVTIQDEEVKKMLSDHLKDLTQNKEADFLQLMQETRALMAKRIFSHHLKYDLICLQEADYLDPTMFPENFQVLFSETSHSKNGIAWNTKRFELVESIGNILGRAFVVKLLDKETDKTLLVASGHITGCNPFRVENDANTGASDAEKGDSEIIAIIELFNALEADLMLIGMDSNVTSLHPRLNILKEAGYQIDYENYLDPTCTNPNLVLNTRIDWITVKPNNSLKARVTNIPVLSVGLNQLQTNISDHKPIAAKIEY